jgi:hypothetical protein
MTPEQGFLLQPALPSSGWAGIRRGERAGTPGRPSNASSVKPISPALIPSRRFEVLKRLLGLVVLALVLAAPQRAAPAAPGPAPSLFPLIPGVVWVRKDELISYKTP